MPQTVYANNRGVIHKGSGTQNITFPDVCKTPTPSGPVPIPYPNIGMASDTSGGPKKVKVDGKMPLVKGASYSKTSGDEPGSAGGVISGVNRAKAELMNFSFDVKFEGKNVGRMGDILFHNRKNILG